MVDDLVVTGGPDCGHHLVGYQTQELVSRLWSGYPAKGGGRGDRGVVISVTERSP